MRSHRPERVGNVIRGVVSDAIAGKLSDPRIERLSSVTRVEVSPDLTHAKVWVSVIGPEAKGRLTLAGLRSAAGVVQRMVARELATRTIPRLHFQLDDSIKRGDETIRMINEAMAELDDDASSPRGAEPSGDHTPSAGDER